MFFRFYLCRLSCDCCCVDLRPLQLPTRRTTNVTDDDACSYCGARLHRGRFNCRRDVLVRRQEGLAGIVQEENVLRARQGIRTRLALQFIDKQLYFTSIVKIEKFHQIILSSNRFFLFISVTRWFLNSLFIQLIASDSTPVLPIVCDSMDIFSTS